MNQANEPLYFAELTRRLVSIVKERRNESRVNARCRGFNLARLARESGIPYWTLVSLFTRQDRALSLDQLDKILYALKLTVLDLIYPVELAQRYDSYGHMSRYDVRRKAASGKYPMPVTEK